MKIFTGILSGIGIVIALTTVQSCTTSQAAGPNGGAVVLFKNNQAKAEIVANGDSGAIMIHLWDMDLKQRRPIEIKPIMIGNGYDMVELKPFPMAGDPTGFCSRFSGRANWLRGGNMDRGWIGGGMNQQQQEFDWNTCFKAGQAHGEMWNDMKENHGGMMGHDSGSIMGHQ